MEKQITRAEIKKAIKGLEGKQLIYFAWICAVRALPFYTWESSEEISMRRLYSVFYSLDMAVAAYTNFANYDTLQSTAIKANEAVSVAYAAGFAAKTAVFAIDCNKNGADEAAYAAADSANDVFYKHTRNSVFRIALDDIKKIKKKDYGSFDTNLELYGNQWVRFHEQLRSLGGNYWSNLYMRIFENGFDFQQDDIISVKHRINVPIEYREQGAIKVAEYLENAERQGTVETLREARLIILGWAGAGKTTLARRLIGDTSKVEPGESTHGVDTTIEIDLNGIRSHVWDFGGQAIYHTSHRCFMYANCVYILVINTREEEHRNVDRIEYWLDTIRIYSNNRAQVFIVINETDNRKQNVEEYNFLKTGEYSSIIYNIYSFNVEKDMDSVNGFKELLANYIEATGHIPFGKNDDLAMRSLMTLFSKDKQLLDASELDEILLKSGIRSKKDQERAKELFNTLGIALSYDFMDGYVLDPYWISHGVYKVIDYLQGKTEFIRYDELGLVFKDEEASYPITNRDNILNLMSHYQIGFQNKGGVRGLIVPCAAPLEKPNDIAAQPAQNSLITRIEREDLRVFPADFFYNFICANEDDIQRQGNRLYMWQKGMVLACNDTNALVELKQNSRIVITVWGKNKDKYRNELVSRIDALLKKYYFKSLDGTQKNSDGKVIQIITLVLDAAQTFLAGIKP